MSKTSDLLFEYLRNLVYEEDAVVFDVAQLDEEYQMLGEGILYLGTCLIEARDFARAIAKGNLSAKVPPPSNGLASSLKALHATLKHLTWQTKQVAQGEYSQHIDFMGEFSDAFNTMIKQLDQRQRALEEEIEVGRQKTIALENSNSLMQAITNEISHWIFVVDGETDELLFLNKTAEIAMKQNELLRDKLRKQVLETYRAGMMTAKEAIEWCTVVKPSGQEAERYFSVTSYPIQWRERVAVAHMLKDISDEREHLKLLENRAYRDPLTNMRNRFYGMQKLSIWLDEERDFCVCFADLDNLKYVNDTFGHSEGDKYIIMAANMLVGFSQESVACRIGGDEFMLMAPNMDRKTCEEKMEKIRKNMEATQSVQNEYVCSISYGVVRVREEPNCSAGELLALADERMYRYKRARKLERGRASNS